MISSLLGVFRGGRVSAVSARTSPKGSTADTAPPAVPEAEVLGEKKHVIFMVHGLFGNRANWNVISKHLREQLDQKTTLIHISHVNEYTKTYDGVDICGERLCEEIREVVGRHPRLERISLLGHSMGGLIARYAAGCLFDPSSRTICGLRPCHFVSIATPHLGCDGEGGPAQVPLIGWSSAVPAIGGGVSRLLSGAAVPFAHLAFGRAGLQFFLMDREGGGTAEPLLLRMTRDHPVEGHFLSALSAFETRTCYANSSGDHLVGWANSSLRHTHQLPRLRGRGAGVVREDPLEAAWKPEAREQLRAAPFSRPLHAAEGGHQVSAGDIFRARSPQELAERGAHPGTATATAAAPPPQPSTAGGEGASSPLRPGRPRTSWHGPPGSNTLDSTLAGEREGYVGEMLERLQQLSWRRVDVCFGRTVLPFLSHQHIQAQRWWVNWPGVATAKHVAMQVAAMEELREGWCERRGGTVVDIPSL